jgi:5-methylcytosine-specific restriction enzyme subunit McrC
LGCSQAILVYPRPLPQPLDAQIGAVRVRSLAFTLGDDLETAGQTFLTHLMRNIACDASGNDI